jgi:hypothetical protein
MDFGAELLLLDIRVNQMQMQRNNHLEIPTVRNLRNE